MISLLRQKAGRRNYNLDVEREVSEANLPRVSIEHKSVPLDLWNIAFVAFTVIMSWYILRNGLHLQCHIRILHIVHHTHEK